MPRASTSERSGHGVSISTGSIQALVPRASTSKKNASRGLDRSHLDQQNRWSRRDGGAIETARAEPHT
ncbi:hypothetical protein JF66_12530 [Cryobacterium sp. MLB-32]|nr:hypothetical protein JF66_12530 [Cryobacterium sp. MLB-32]